MAGTHHSVSHHSGSHHRSGGSHSSHSSSNHSSTHRRAVHSAIGYSASSNIPSIPTAPTGARYYANNEYKKCLLASTAGVSTWMLGKQFEINESDPYYKANYPHNKDSHYKFVSSLLAVLTIIFFFMWITNLFYEIVIPIFENMNMTDEAFAVIDEVVFCTPFLLAITFIVAHIALIMKHIAMRREFCKEMLDHYEKIDALNKEQEKKAAAARWFYTECPHCGAPAAEEAQAVCAYCGSSLIKDVVVQ